MNHQSGHIDVLQILAKILQPSRNAGQAGCRGCTGSDVPTGAHHILADALTQKQIRVVEVFEEIGEKCVSICGHGLFDSLENAGVDALRVIGGFEQKRRHGADEDGLADSLRAVFAEVARNFAATHRESHKREILELQLRNQFSEVRGERVVVVALSRLTGFAEASAVIGDHPVSRIQQHRHLLFPGGAAQRISVNQYDGLTGTMVFIIDVEVSSVFFPDGDVWHGNLSW